MRVWSKDIRWKLSISRRKIFICIEINGFRVVQRHSIFIRTKNYTLSAHIREPKSDDISFMVKIECKIGDKLFKKSFITKKLGILDFNQDQVMEIWAEQDENPHLHTRSRRIFGEGYYLIDF